MLHSLNFYTVHQVYQLISPLGLENAQPILAEKIAKFNKAIQSLATLECSISERTCSYILSVAIGPESGREVEAGVIPRIALPAARASTRPFPNWLIGKFYPLGIPC